MAFSAEHPSPEYLELLQWARDFHAARKSFTGLRVIQSYTPIKRLIDRYGAATVLDWGAGKGQQYAARNFTVPGHGLVPSLVEGWNVTLTPYDPAWPPYAQKPTGTFDGVICTDVLEYVPEQDMPWVVAELLAHATKFVFCHLAVRPSKKRPQGVPPPPPRPAAWWAGVFIKAKARQPQADWWVEVRDGAPTPVVYTSADVGPDALCRRDHVLCAAAPPAPEAGGV